VLVWVTAFVSLIPLGRLVADWVELSRVLTGTSVQMSDRSFDWVHWNENEGIIYAAYVVPQGPAAHGGIQDGDVFFMLEGQQYFNVVDLQRAIEGIDPGASRTYFVQREGDIIEASVRFTRYPTFLYPLSATLWHFSVWGFLAAAFVHVIGLVIAGPLAFRSREGRFSLLLIAASALWIFGNLLRLLVIELLGPPMAIGGAYDRIFQAFSVLGLIGWIGFPALLVHRVLGDVPPAVGAAVGSTRFVVYVPAAVLGTAAFMTAVRGGMGPITVDGLVGPILFYVCCFIATAGCLMLLRSAARTKEADSALSVWNRWGSAAMVLLALLFGLSVLGVVPIFGVVTDTISAWLIVAAQLLSVVPVILVSHATIKHGKVGQVLNRGLTYVTVSGVIFFAFVGGLSAMEPYLEGMEVSRNVVAGLYAVVLLIGAEWLIGRFRGTGMNLFAADRRSMYHSVQQLQEQMRNMLDYEALAQRTIDVVGEAFGTRWAVLFLRPSGTAAPWITGTHHPQPPYLTERVMSLIWPHLSVVGSLWARNPELNEVELPDHLRRLALERGAALLVPVVGSDALVGVLALGNKVQRRAVYNLEEVDLLRTLAGQLALAVERLKLVERERELVRESAESQLVALRAQINPHFLFNSLNTIVALIEERPEEAEEIVEHLASIFRYILQAGGSEFVSMQDEIQLVKHYLSIEQSRFGEALTIDMQLDPRLHQVPVPAFIVQTLVENAVKHGLGKRRGGGGVRIQCRPSGEEHVEIIIADTGVGIPDLFQFDGPVTSEQDFFGIGLRNVSARLEKLYGRADLLSIRSDPEAGTTVTIELPGAAADRNGKESSPPRAGADDLPSDRNGRSAPPGRADMPGPPDEGSLGLHP
jgi:two-component sensor histidine kinase